MKTEVVEIAPNSELPIETLALMHAPAYRGEPARALRDLAAGYAARMRSSVSARPQTRTRFHEQRLQRLRKDALS